MSMWMIEGVRVGRITTVAHVLYRRGVQAIGTAEDNHLKFSTSLVGADDLQNESGVSHCRLCQPETEINEPWTPNRSKGDDRIGTCPALPT